MEEYDSYRSKKPATIRNENESPAFTMMVVMLLVVVVASAIFLIQYQPAPEALVPQITFEEKMAHLEAGTPLPQQNARPEIPRWMMAMILGFVVIQIMPLLLAAYKAGAEEFTRRDLRQIEFLAETPLHLGLLGSLLGVCMTHFLTGTLSAPLAYLTTISGILMYLFGRFTILVSLPSSNDFT
jgi:NADH:ubiquinone oxidoreductase subunit 3 (subunit A)